MCFVCPIQVLHLLAVRRRPGEAGGRLPLVPSPHRGGARGWRRDPGAELGLKTSGRAFDDWGAPGAGLRAIRSWGRAGSAPLHVESRGKRRPPQTRARVPPLQGPVKVRGREEKLMEGGMGGMGARSGRDREAEP
ncbi:hypothetical protein JCM30394_14360 [Deferrisoma palaeochoriense]